MTEMIFWLRTQLDTDEQLALSASPAPWRPNAEHDEVLAVDDVTVADGFALSGRQLRATVEHIANNDPARVLRQVQAHRTILDAYERCLESRERHDAESLRIKEDIARQERGEPVVGHLDVRIGAHRREADYLDAMEPELRNFVNGLVSIYSDRDGYAEATGGER